MSSIQDIVTRVQWELRGAGAAWLNQDYILGALSIVNDDIEMELQNLGLNFDTQVVILANVPADTLDLSQYQADGQPLSGMVLPKVVEWRLAGQSQMSWNFVPPVDAVVDTDTGTGEQGATVASSHEGIDSWEWRAGVLEISPSGVVVDIRVRFQSLPTNLTADSPYQPFRGLVNPLTYAVCEHIEVQRVGGTSANAAKFKEYKTRALGTFRATQVQGQHSKPTRLGGRRSGITGWNGGFTPPIVG